MIRFAFVLRAGACVFACLVMVGCGSTTVGKAPDPTESHLKILGAAYVLATDTFGQPPRNREDLIQGLKALKEKLTAASDPDNENPDKEKPQITWEPADVLRSANDGEDFVVIYNVDYREFSVSRTPRDLPVIAYEKTGKDGKRYVLRIRFVSLVSDDDFPNLKFPQGYKP